MTLAGAFGELRASAAAYKFTTLDFPPLEYLDDKMQPTGAAVDIVKEVMKRLGHESSVELLPWTRSLNLVKEGKSDGVFTCYRTPEREAFLDFSTEVLIPQVVSLYVRKGDKLGFEGDLKALKGKTIGIVSTISYGTRFDEAKETHKLKTDRVESLDLNFKKLLSGRLDLVISNRYSAQVEIERMKIEDQVEEIRVPVEVIPSYVGWSKKNGLTGLRDQFDKELKSLKRSGRYDEILKQYKLNVPQI